MPDTVTSLSIADSRTYSISELAREFGITPRALRFYEDKDMLHPARDGMTRVYSHRDRGRVKIIVRLKRLGLPLADIREILDLYGLEDGQRAQMRMSLVKFQNQIKELESQREDIEMALQELHNGIEWLEEQGFADFVLVTGYEAVYVADLLAEKDVPVVLGPVLGMPSRDSEPYDFVYTVPAKLHQAGVRFVFSDVGDARCGRPDP